MTVEGPLISEPTEKFELEMDTLNAGDWFDVEMVAVGGEITYPKIAARIIGETRRMADALRKQGEMTRT